MAENELYYSETGVITKSKNVKGDLIIPDRVPHSPTTPITKIGDGAFMGCKELTSVVIPDSVTEIGNSAFDGCTGLTSVIIPDSVTKIRYYAFFGCTGLTSVIIPDSVTEIEALAFEGCSGLQTIDITKSIADIDNAIFRCCSNIKRVKVNPENERYTAIDGVLYNKSISKICCYPQARIEPFIIPDSVTEIGAYAFDGCSSLTSVVIPNSVTKIGTWTFYDCSALTSVVIPDSVTEIGEDAFSGCSELTWVKSEIKEPFAIDDVFEPAVMAEATLYVPAGTASKYRAIEGWKNFANIVEDSEVVKQPEPSKEASTQTADTYTTTEPASISNSVANDQVVETNMAKSQEVSALPEQERPANKQLALGMSNIDLQNLGALELMEILHQLHNMGYQKLRWFSYMSPNGCALRCYITIQDNIRGTWEILEWSQDVCFGASCYQMTTGQDIMPYLELFIRQNQALLNRGKGEDKAYVAWFNDLLREATEGNTPIFDAEYWSLPIGKIEVGSKMYPAPPMTMRIISWDIDGIEDHFDDLKRLIQQHSPEIICLQKVKDIKGSKKFKIDGYVRKCNADPYSGVVTYSKRCIPCDHYLLNEDSTFTGHLIQTKIRYPNLTLYNIYTPYSNPQVEGAIEARVQFDTALQRLVSVTADRMIVCGDMNIVHSNRDCWNREYECNQPNFQHWERENFNRLLQSGNLIDSYRVFHRVASEYSYFFRNDKKVRECNQGQRIDYFLCSRSLEPQIIRSEILKDFTASANNPILLEFRY